MLKNHMLIYQPALAGHWLASLLRLDDLPVSAKRARHWGEITANRGQAVNGCWVRSIHPAEFDITRADFNREIYYRVVLPSTPWHDFWLIRSRQRWDYAVGCQRPEDAQAEHRLMNSMDLTDISIAPMLHRLDWQDHYQRLTELMGLPCDVPRARDIHQAWYAMRVEPLLEEFAHIDSVRAQSYQRQRRWECQWGSSRAWWNFYRQVREPWWPDCDNECDFPSLPERIKQECMHLHGYRPPIGKYPYDDAGGSP